ncbi:hypothetical protein ACS0TY_018251 [Phlomoides rotata]
MTQIIEGIANNSFSIKMDRGNQDRVAQVDEHEAMKTMIMTLAEKFDALSSTIQRDTIPPSMQESHIPEQGVQQNQGGNYHQGKPHYQNQPQGQFQQGSFPQNSQGRYNANSNFQGGNSSSFTPNFKNHENFSYANQKAAIQFPPGFNSGAKPLNNEGRPSQDELLALMFKKMEEKDAKMDEFMKSTSSQIKTLENQMG